MIGPRRMSHFARAGCYVHTLFCRGIAAWKAAVKWFAYSRYPQKRGFCSLKKKQKSRLSQFRWYLRRNGLSSQCVSIFLVLCSTAVTYKDRSWAKIGNDLRKMSDSFRASGRLVPMEPQDWIFSCAMGWLKLCASRVVSSIATHRVTAAMKGILNVVKSVLLKAWARWTLWVDWLDIITFFIPGVLGS